MNAPPFQVAVLACACAVPGQCVNVRCFSGAKLGTIIKKCLDLDVRSDILILHAGVNDASRGGGASFANDFALGALKACFSGAKVAVSTVCLTRSGEINLRVAAANERLRGLARSGSFALILNDNIRVTDLTDTVHLNAAGTARLFNNILLSWVLERISSVTF